ncbi:hypothetical protein [Mesorhizobium sp. M0037]|uniref:hypothetical protein n=1 Tax=unclassified Mesorhizobium TaxID=325217 RepID=UPI00333E0E76
MSVAVKSALSSRMREKTKLLFIAFAVLVSSSLPSVSSSILGSSGDSSLDDYLKKFKSKSENAESEPPEQAEASKTLSLQCDIQYRCSAVIDSIHYWDPCQGHSLRDDAAFAINLSDGSAIVNLYRAGRSFRAFADDASITLLRKTSELTVNITIDRYNGELTGSLEDSQSGVDYKGYCKATEKQF